MSFNMTTSGAILYKAGANVNSTAAASSAIIASFCDQAESVVNVNSNYNWSDAYSGLNDDVKGVLNDAVTSLAATYLINYDMSGYTSRSEAQGMVDILLNSFNRDMATLKEQVKKDFVSGA